MDERPTAEVVVEAESRQSTGTGGTPATAARLPQTSGHLLAAQRRVVTGPETVGVPGQLFLEVCATVCTAPHARLCCRSEEV